MAEKPDLKPETIESLRLWKQQHYKNWSSKSKKDKISDLNWLIMTIMKAEKSTKDWWSVNTDFYGWEENSGTFFINKNRPSIISTLHEIGHALHGRSELEACRFSVWLFKIVFPKSHEKLKSEGHLLIQ
jgi:hypothetical protein